MVSEVLRSVHEKPYFYFFLQTTITYRRIEIQNPSDELLTPESQFLSINHRPYVIQHNSH